MTITVYWSCFEKEWMRASEPEPVIKRLYSRKKTDAKNSNINIGQCPSINGYLKNMFALKSLYDYEFSIFGNDIRSNDYTQEFMNDHLLIRDIEDKFFSFFQKYIFFTEEDSLNMSAYLHPIFENNEIERKTFSIPGEFDIGKWFRNIEFPFYLKDNEDTFSITSEDYYTYIKFDTNEKIIFKQFIPTKEIEFYLGSTLNSYSHMKHGSNSLEDYYHLFKFKDIVINEIKKNLIT